MKNIHLIPTDKPSRFSLNSSGKYHLTKQLYTNSPNFTAQNIYITNNEEIKEGDIFIHPDGTIERASRNLDGRGISKIILTTDVDLIKDGVQAIDDEFLEWFVNNPSCEEVEVERDEREVGGHNGGVQIEYGLYKIIIPKEEPKKEIVKDLAYWKANAEEDYMKVPISVLRYISELENQMYSKEEVLQLIINCKERFGGSDLDDYVEDSIVIKWFEQFKKKL